jgi:chitin synthase
MYPYIQTIQSLNALAYTKVPSNLKVFLSQRRRWSLGATMNDLLLVYKLPT